MTEEKERRKAQRAERLKQIAEHDDGLFAILDKMEASYTGRLFATDVAQSTEREALYQRVRTIHDIRETVKGAIQRGEDAEKMLARLAEKNANE